MFNSVTIPVTSMAGFSFEGGMGGDTVLKRSFPPPIENHSSEICLGLFNIACFFTEVPHNLVQTKSYILKYGVSLSRLDHATSLAGDT